MSDRNAPVGVFDSGVGGLTVAREIMRQLPNERIVYFGDTARVPYGSKSRDTVLRYSRQIIRFLRTREVKAIVIACNTATALTLDTVAAESDIPIIGVIHAGAKTAVESTRNGRIGVIGTEATIGSGIYTEVMKKMKPGIQVFGKSCPLFVPLVEEGWLHDPVTDEIASRYLSILKERPRTSEAVVTTGTAFRISAVHSVRRFAPPTCPERREIANCPASSTTITAGSVSLSFKYGAISRTAIPAAPIKISPSHPAPPDVPVKNPPHLQENVCTVPYISAPAAVVLWQ